MSVSEMPVMRAVMTAGGVGVSIWEEFDGKNGRGRGRAHGGLHILENPTMLYTLNLCALSAHTLPLTTSLSHGVICAARSRKRASRSLATFSAGVSLGGELPWVPFCGSIGGGGWRAFGLGRALGVARGMLEAEGLEAEARLIRVGFA